MKNGGVIVGLLWAIAVSVAVYSLLNQSGDRERLTDRTAQLERDTAVLKDEIRRLTKNDDAMVQANLSALGDLAEVHIRAGLTDEHNKFVPHWWCVNGNGICLRTEVECKARIEQYRREMPKEPRLQNAECMPWRIAYCDAGHFCVGSLKQCETLKLACVGVE